MKMDLFPSSNERLRVSANVPQTYIQNVHWVTLVTLAVTVGNNSAGASPPFHVKDENAQFSELGFLYY